LSSVVLATQILKLVLIVVSHSLVPTHAASGVKRLSYAPTSSWHAVVIGPFINWDAAHFVSIALSGYNEPMSYAFFPLFPLVLRSLGQMLGLISPFAMNDIERVVVAGVVFNNLCLTLSCIVLNELFKVHSIPAIKRHCAILCFVLNPASIFFSVVYSESLYSMLSWAGMYFLTVRKSTPLSSLFFAGASFTRSNGMFNSAFVLIYSFCKSAALPISMSSVRKSASLCCVFLATLLPYFLYNSFAHTDICSTSQQDSPLCINNSLLDGFIGIYSRIQKKYWSVTLLGSFRLNQLPNIVLAVPVIVLTTQCVWCFFKSLRAHWLTRSPKLVRDVDLMPFYGVLMCNIFVVVFFAHIQVSTRIMFSSCPVLYLTMSDDMLDIKSGCRMFTVVYIVAFNLLGILLHPNFYPWT
ncbi:unnamed protein product, partial [Ectocarpus fasciculatus]